ncbi:hypothetical protein [Streptomyces atratus]|uniref:hypothetical protein n=1 Tax=Streptomyces atratus TaxID=1893 RepID=UPI0033D183FC
MASHVVGDRAGRKQPFESAGIDDDRVGPGLLRTGPCLVGDGVPGEQEPGT